MIRADAAEDRPADTREDADAAAEAPAPFRPLALHHLGDVHVGARMALRRQAAGLPVRALAAALGLTYQQVRKYERGKDRIPAGHLPMIAATLGVEVGWLFEGLPGVVRKGVTGPQAVLVEALEGITDREVIATLGRLAKHLSGQSVSRQN